MTNKNCSAYEPSPSLEHAQREDTKNQQGYSIDGHDSELQPLTLLDRGQVEQLIPDNRVELPAHDLLDTPTTTISSFINLDVEVDGTEVAGEGPAALSRLEVLTNRTGC